MLQLTEISKSFPGVKALIDVSITFNEAEVHALCGENGAGKSTLMHIVAGNLQPDAGSIYFDGNKVTIENVQMAQQMGIGIVYQERTLAGSLSVAENIFPLNPPLTRLGLIDFNLLNEKAAQLLNELGLTHIPQKTLVDELSPGAKQLVEIARALAQEPKLLVLDEPTASLTSAETTVLFSVIKKLVAKGTGVIYISHRMNELAMIADVISVLKDGVYQGAFNAKETTADFIINKMVGRELKEAAYVSHAQQQPALEIKHLTGENFFDASFTLYRGEILGVAGLEGSGRSAMARVIFADKKIVSGNILKNGKEIYLHHPADAITAGIAYLPEERKSLGLFMEQDIASNIAVASMNEVWCNEEENIITANEYKNMLGIKAGSVRQAVQDLSGGNQQKVVLAKWLNANPDVFIINEPTHGVDVGAKAGIYEELKKLTAEGKSILLISSDLPELLLLCDRMMVMYNGKIRATLQRNEFSEESITALASGI